MATSFLLFTKKMTHRQLCDARSCTGRPFICFQLFAIFIILLFCFFCVDDAPAEEAALDPEVPTTEADADSELNVEPDEDEEAEHTAEVGRGSV